MFTKLIIAYYLVHVTFSRSPRSKVKSGNNGHIMNSMDSEPLKRFQPKLTQILHAVRRRRDYVYKVMYSKVKVTDNIGQKCTFPAKAYRLQHCHKEMQIC